MAMKHAKSMGWILECQVGQNKCVSQGTVEAAVESRDQPLKSTWPISARSDNQLREGKGLESKDHHTAQRLLLSFLGLASPCQLARNNIPESCRQVSNSGEKL